jgi:hypothetical protein
MSPSLAEEVTPQNDGSVLIDGSANIRELNKAFNWHCRKMKRTDERDDSGSAGRDPGTHACALSSTILISWTCRTI